MISRLVRNNGQVNGDVQISTPIAAKPLNRFWWNSNHRTITRRPPTTQNVISIRRRGWSGRTPSLPLSGFFLCFSFFFGLFVTRTGRTGGPILTTYRPTSFDVFPPMNVPFVGFVDNDPHLGGQIPQNPNFGDVNRRFQDKLAKAKTTASIPTKFCTVIKTTKCPSCVVRTHASLIQEDGRHLGEIE